MDRLVAMVVSGCIDMLHTHCTFYDGCVQYAHDAFTLHFLICISTLLILMHLFHIFNVCTRFFTCFSQTIDDKEIIFISVICKGCEICLVSDTKLKKGHLQLVWLPVWECEEERRIVSRRAPVQPLKPTATHTHTRTRTMEMKHWTHCALSRRTRTHERQNLVQWKRIFLPDFQRGAANSTFEISALVTLLFLACKMSTKLHAVCRSMIFMI